MKILACVLLVCSAVPAFQVNQTAPLKQNILTSDQVLAWLTYYGLPLDKDIAEAISMFGQPDAATRSTRQWNPSSRTGYRVIFADIRVKENGGGTTLRITVYPHPSDVLSVNELLHRPEMFIFDSGHQAKLGSYFTAETRSRQIRIQFLCGPDHDPQFQSVILKSIASPDEIL
jgi:hypothetical protein